MNQNEPVGALIVKSLLGLTFLIVVLGLMLFISAGTTDFWQAWVYLAVFAASCLLITIYLIRFDQRLLASRTQAGPVAEAQRSQKVIQAIASVCFIAIYIVAGLDRRFHWSAIPAVVSLIADVLVASGFLIVFLVFRENSYTSATIEVAREQKVIDTGPYAVVRHPMYAGAGVLLLFTAPALGSWVALPFVVLIMIVIGLRLLEEEKFLATQLAGYAAYQRKVHHRLIPFVW